MNHPWQQPIRPLEVYPTELKMWRPVLFIRPKTDRGWEVITMSGSQWSSNEAVLRHAD